MKNKKGLAFLLAASLLVGSSRATMWAAQTEEPSRADFSNYITSVEGSGSVYNPSTNEFVTDLDFSTKITVGDVLKYGTQEDGYYVFIYGFPSTIKIPDSQIEKGKSYFYFNGEEVGAHEFIDDGDGTYSFVVYYRDEYLSSHSEDARIDVDYDFGTGISDQAIEDAERLRVKINEDVDLVIGLDQVTFPEDDSYFSNISMGKTGSYEIMDDTLSYEVTVLSEKGTPGPVKITDSLTLPSGISLNKLLKVKVTGDSGEITLQENGDGDPNTYTYKDGTLTMTLPQLEAGGQYLLRYEYQLDDISNLTNTTAKNTATALSETDTQSVRTTVTKTTPIDKRILSKVVESKNTSTVKWVIKVNQAGGNIGNSLASDSMFQNACTNSEFTAQNNISVWNNTTNRQATTDTDFSYVFDSDGKVTGIRFLSLKDSDGDQVKDYNGNQYTITYYTPSSYGTNVNQVTLEGTYHATAWSYEQTATTYVSPPSTSVSKTADLNNVTYDQENRAIIPWTATYMVVGQLDQNRLIFDLLRNNTSTLSDDHYMTKAQLEDGFYSHLGNTTTDDLLYYTDEDHFYVWVHQSDFQSVPTNIMSRSPSTGTFYLVKYKDLLNGNLPLAEGVNAYTVKYHGVGFYLTSAVPSGSYTLSYKSTGVMNTTDTTVKFNNDLEMKDTNLTSNVSVNVPVNLTGPAVEKFAIVNGARSDQATYTMDNKDTSFTWTVKVKPYGSDHQSITVVDTLPAGISLESLWTGNMIYAPTSYPITIGKNGTLSGNRGDVAITGSLVKNQDGTQTVTLIFTPKNGTTSQSWFQNYTGSGDNFHIIYCCSIGEDAKNYPQAGEMATLSFTNQVQVYYDKDQAKAAQAANTIQAAIDRRPEVKETLEKTGTWDNASKTLGYEIQLNPYGADLVADTDTLEVVDTLIYPKSASKSVSLLMNSMELYEAELGEDDQGYPKIVQGNKVDALNWSWKVLESDQVINGREMEVSQITASVPDSMALILKYKYLVMQEEEGQLDITNTVAIKGTVYEVSLDSNSQDGWVNSYAGVTVHVTAALTMYKVDEQNYEITLEDSRFAIFGYEEGSWEDTGMVLTTDSSGRFSVSANVFQDDIEEETMEGTTPVLKKNKAYYLQEIQPPGGYDLPESPPKYGFYYDEDQTTGDYPHGWESSTGFSRVVNLARESATEYVENSRKTMAVSVTKTWEMNGEVTTAHPNRLSVTLKQYAVKRTTADRLVEQGKTLSEALATLVDREDEDCWLVETAARTLSDGNKRNDQWVYTWESLPVSGLDPDHDDVEVYYYYLIEEDSPQGWESQSQVVYGTDEEGGETQRTDFVNSMTGYLLPSTGGVTSELFELLGFLILTAGLVTAWYRKKTEGRNKNTR